MERAKTLAGECHHECVLLNDDGGVMHGRYKDDVAVLQGVALGTDAGGAFLVVAESTRVYRLPKPSNN